MSLNKILKSYDSIFWDFDGVIKDSVEIKNNAFEELFSRFDKEVVIDIKRHHIENIGLSRFEKIPLYLSFAGENVTKKQVKEYYEKYSFLVKSSVINSKWVPGVLNYLDSNFKKKSFLL